jgi:hypothetical protein
MKDLLDAVQGALDALRVTVGDREAGGMAPAELIAANDAVGALRRRVDAVMLPVAAEIARQSRRDLGGDSLAKRQGYRNAEAMISTSMGTSTGEAARLVAVGEATAPRALLTGQVMPPKHPSVAAALRNGSLGSAAAAAIVAMLDRVAPRVDGDDAAAMEVRLVAAAPGLTPDQVRTLLACGEAVLDPDGVRPREEELRAERSLTIRQDLKGAVLITGRLDAETAAPIVSAVEGIVSGMLHRAEDGISVAQTDPRTIAQMRADALSELCRHTLSCAEVATGPSATIVVRMSLADLQAGTGVGTIGGLDQPVSAGTVRRMAAEANIIPCVLGVASEILDWGRAKRGFTPAQKLALAERDGGCAFCGLPPALTQAHHLRWWSRDRGPTDLSNGVLLCTTCHHRVHDDGWEVRVEPPPGVASDSPGALNATTA